MAARPPATGINGRPVAISPRMAYHQTYDQSPGGGGGGGLLSSILCGGSDSPFLLCDGSPRNNEVNFDINPTGVYVAVHTKQWNLACERVKIYPREASTWVVRYGSPDASTAADSGASGSSSDAMVAVASPRSRGLAMAPSRASKIIRWRMLPLHASILFDAPVEVVRTILKAYPAGCSSKDDQGMLPLHLAFRSGSSEEIVLLLLDAYPEAIECVDYKSRLPSMLAPKDAMSYGDTIGEAFVRGPSHYYWSARVATADRLRSEMVMTAKIKQLEQNTRMNTNRDKEMLDETENQLTEEINGLALDNVELKERLVWYETKYDGAEEKEKVLVDHTNSLAERLRLTSLSEEHLATKLAKLEARLQNKEMELDQARMNAIEEKEALGSRVTQLEQALVNTEHKAESLTEKLEKKVLESNEMKVRFEKERQLFERQIDASKECLMELIASSKEDKRMFEQDSKELRRQLLDIQSEVQRASLTEKRMHEEDSQDLRRQLLAIQSEVQKASNNSSRNDSASTPSAAAAVLSQSLEDRLDNLQRELTNNTRSFMSRVDVLETEEQQQRDFVLQRQTSSAKKIEDRLDSLHKEVANARSFGGRNYNVEPAAVRHTHKSSTKSTKQPKKKVHKKRAEIIEEEEDTLFDEYVSTKSATNRNSTADDQTRDDSECGAFSHDSDVDTAMALGELTEEQRLALESLDLGGSKEDIAAMLSKVPGLTKNQVNLLVDVASSLVA